jgi:hypothetical protein
MSFRGKLGVAGTTPSILVDACRRVKMCFGKNQNGISSEGGTDGAAAASAGGVED